MNFRRVFIALVVMALFAGLAGAQSTTKPAITCTVAAGNTLTPRAEGITEKVGDVTLTCGTWAGTVGNTLVSGNAAQRFDITVDFGVPVTSRVDTAAGFNPGFTGNNYFPSEIVLMFNSPGAGGGPVANFGQNVPASLCTTANAWADRGLIRAAGGVLASATNCAAYYHNDANGVASPWVLANTAAANPGAGTAAANVYQGAVNPGDAPTKVTFYDVPVVNSQDATVTNIFRIANVRVTPGAAAVTATVASSNSAPSALVTTSYTFSLATVEVPTVATPASAFAAGTPAVVAGPALSSCGSTALNPTAGQNRAYSSLLKFQEASNTSFKTRVIALTNVLGAGNTGSGSGQINVSGSYGTNPTRTADESESGYYYNQAVGTGTIGIADNGTRFKAVFAGLDPSSKVQYFVSTNNVQDAVTPAVAPTVGIGDQTQTPYAVLLPLTGGAGFNVETQAYSAATAYSIQGVGGIPVAQLSVSSSGAAEAVWEVTNASRSAKDTFMFVVYAVYNPTIGIPTVGSAATVQLGLAATTSATATSSNATAIPRFAAPSMTATPAVTVLPCQTSLLFPYVVGNSGYNTGLAISNTSADPYGTTPAAGICSLNFYSSATAASYTTPSVAAGTTYTALLNTTNQLSDSVGTATLTNFAGQGYMFATCSFQFAHGFAFIDTAPGQPAAMAMGYVANVVSSTSRGTTLLGEALEN